jgi:hypothetical protein
LVSPTLTVGILLSSGRDEQMFGEKQQVRRGGQSD